MKIVKLLMVLSCSFFLLNCQQGSQSKNSNDLASKIDTTKAVKIDRYWAKPKPSLEFNSFLENRGDTLSIVSCADYVYSPFGAINNKSELQSSLLRNFSVSNRIDKIEEESIEFQILRFKGSKLSLYFDTALEDSKRSNIFKGEIKDSEVSFVNGIKIGMDKEAFYKIFFDEASHELMEKYNYIAIASCVQDITHTYLFQDNKLQSVKFTTDSYWKVDY